MVRSTHYQYSMQGDGPPDNSDLAGTIQIPRFGAGQKIFRRYTLQKIIGRGGMGVVWLAQDSYLESLVALKVLPDTLLHDSASLDSLKRETKLGLSLAHPNIVRIYDFQNDESAAAISMEYVDGGNLSDLRIKKPSKVLDTSDLTGWLEALFDGLDYAHNRQQIVHRDLKPRNLMLNSRGELKIADFGISRSISDSMTMLTGMLASTGSPPYVSPQQWDGERPTPLDDIYSLGATLYELLTSKPPLLGVVDWQQVHYKVAPKMWQRRLDLGIKGADPIPAQWEEAIAACLAKDPKDRPQSIQELRTRLSIAGPQAVNRTGRRSSPLPGAPADASPVQDEIDDSSEKTIKGSAALPDRPDEVRVAGDEGLFDEPTLRQIRDSPNTAEPSDDIESGATLQSRKPEPKIQPDEAVRKPRKVPVWSWLALIAVGLLGAIAYVVLVPGRTVVVPSVPSPAVHEDLPVQSSTPGVTVTEQQQPPPEQFGTLSVSSNPPGASILLDDNPPNQPPDTFAKIPFGKHQLTATLDGYEAFYQELQIDNTNPATKVLELKRPLQWLRLQQLVEDVQKYGNAPDSPEYIMASAKYLQNLYLTDSAPSPELPPDELKQKLEKIIEALRTHQAALKPSAGRQEFQKYKDAITSAAQLDILQATLMLAENETEAHKKFSLFEKAATQRNDPSAMMMLGILYAKGAGDVPGKPDYDKALDWLQKAAKAGNKEAAAYYFEAYLFVDMRTPRTADEQKAAVESLKDLANQGVPHAEVVLGEWYRRSAIAAKDKTLRLKLYRETADRWRKAMGPREWRVCYYLGTLYEKGLLNEDGKPTQDDLNQARALYQQGTDNEDVVCMFNLGRFIWDHSDDSKNQEEKKTALSLIKDAAAAGSEPAKAWIKAKGL